jgi:hypothetical protein
MINIQNNNTNDFIPGQLINIQNNNTSDIVPGQQEIKSEASSKADQVTACGKEAIEQGLIAQVECKENLPVTKYDQQVILSLGRGGTALGLNAKAAKAGIPSESIDLRDSQSPLEAISKLTPRSRLYIAGHCNKGLNSITSDEKVRKTFQDYVDLLIKHAPHLISNTSEDKIKVSVIACFGAVDNGNDKSFGYQLSQALDTAKIRAEVLARTEVMSRWLDDNHPELYQKLVGNKHHENGSKISFVTEKGVTTETPVDYPSKKTLKRSQESDVDFPPNKKRHI